MRTAGGSTRPRATYGAIAFGVAILIALGEFGATAIAAAAPATADTASAAALYEPVAAASAPAATPAAAKSGDGKSPASTSTSSSTAAANLASDADTPTAADGSAEPPAPVVTTETVIVPASTPAPSYVKQGVRLSPSTTEIPQSAGAPEPSTAEIDRATDAQAIYYQAQHNPQMIDPQLHSLQEFMNEGPQTSPLGLDLHEDQRKLNSGEVANGLLIVGVRDGSAAAKVGLHACKNTTRAVVTGVAVAAALFFPPAVLAIPLVEQANLGDSYDMIIGVDGTRVTNFMDFEDTMRDLQPGETVYLSIVRDGKRMQVSVPVGSMSIVPF